MDFRDLLRTEFQVVREACGERETESVIEWIDGDADDAGARLVEVYSSRADEVGDVMDSRGFIRGAAAALGITVTELLDREGLLGGCAECSRSNGPHYTGPCTH